MVVTAKITKAIEGDMEDNVRAESVNFLFYSLFRIICATLKNTPVSELNLDYLYGAYIEKILNFSKETQKTRLVTEG